MYGWLVRIHLWIFFRENMNMASFSSTIAAAALLAACTVVCNSPASAPGYYPPPPPPGDPVAYCMSRFKSYDPGSGTYLGYDGLRHPCP